MIAPLRSEKSFAVAEGETDPVGYSAATNPVHLRDFHATFAWVVIGANALAAVWALAANWLEPLRSRALWWFVVVVQVAIFVQVALGVALVAGEGIEAPQFHMFYGFVAIITVGIIWALLWDSLTFISNVTIDQLLDSSHRSVTVTRFDSDLLDILLGTSTDNNRNGLPDDCCLADTDGSGRVGRTGAQRRAGDAGHPSSRRGRRRHRRTRRR